MLRLFAAALLISSLPSPAAAQERLALHWTGPVGCPGGDEVRLEVARLLGGVIPREGPAVQATASAVRREDRFILELTTRVQDAAGERTLSAEGCGELADAAALILALMIDPAAVARAAPEPLDPPSGAGPTEGPHPDAGATPASALASPLPPGVTEVPRSAAAPESLAATPSLAAAEGAIEIPSPARPARGDASPDEALREPPGAASTAGSAEPPAEASEEPGLSGFLGLGAALDLGTLPNVTGGVIVDGGFGVPLVDGRLRATFLIPQRGEPGGGGVGAEIMTLTVAARGCVRPFDAFRPLGACAGVEAGAVFGSGYGVSNPSFGAGLWVGASGGLSLAWRPERWFDLTVDADLVIPIVDHTFAVTLPSGDLDVFVPEDVAGRFSLTAHVHIF